MEMCAAPVRSIIILVYTGILYSSLRALFMISWLSSLCKDWTHTSECWQLYANIWLITTEIKRKPVLVFGIVTVMLKHHENILEHFYCMES